MFEYSIDSIDPLSFPKGQAPKCELTDCTASVVCITPHISIYYATHAHAELAYKAIIPKIASFLRLVRSSDGTILGTQKVKEEYKLKTMKYFEQLSDICYKQATEYLMDHRYDMAAIVAMHAISFHKKADSNTSNYGSDMIPLLLLLSSAFVGISKSDDYPYSKAFKKDLMTFVEGCLCVTSCIISKDPNIANDVLIKFHRNYGKLLLDGCKGEDLNIQENKDYVNKAIQEFSRYSYSCSLEFGPESLQVCDAYYNLAQSFHILSSTYESTSFLNKVVDIFWNVEVYEKVVLYLEKPAATSALHQEEADELVFLRDREEILQNTVQLFIEYELSELDFVRAELALCGMHTILKGFHDEESTSENMLRVVRRALKIFTEELGEDHEETQKSRKIIDLLVKPN